MKTLKERCNLVYLDVNVRISEWILKTVERASTRMIWLRIESKWRVL
jgi:hypothetical protein